ncbi:MAG TPA: choice-of-anchor D domain-containing protein, partial [Kofleriaceae bacterium]|nr:choice-of-anchor D domain-containing protein [Kofleriaceae bacterium]
MRSLHIRSLMGVVLLASTSCGDNHAAPDAAGDASPGEAILHINLTSSDLGSVTLGVASPAATFTISNTGTVASGAITAALDGDTVSFSVNRNDCATLAAAASCQVAVVFAPTSAGPKATTLRVSANPGGAVTASLSGRGVTLGALSVAASANMLGGVVVGQLGATTATFTVTNTGGTPTGAITIQPAGSDPDEFATSADTCAGHILAAAGSCTFVGTFSPTSAGAKSALFEVIAEPGGSVGGAVSGLGLAPARLVTRTIERNFGSVVVAQSNL